MAEQARREQGQDMHQDQMSSDGAGTRPAPPQARPPGRGSAVTPAFSALGATVGADVRTGDGFCRPPLWRGAC